MSSDAMRECSAQHLATHPDIELDQTSYRRQREEEEEAEAALAEMQHRLSQEGGPNIVRSASGSSIGSVEDLVRVTTGRPLEEGSLATLSTTASNTTDPPPLITTADVDVEVSSPSPPPPPPLAQNVNDDLKSAN